MKKELRNELVRKGRFSTFASIPLSVEILKRHLKSISELPHVPATDFLAAFRTAYADLVVHAPDPKFAEEYVSYDAAERVIISLAVLDRKVPLLSTGPKDDAQRDERRRSQEAHQTASSIAVKLRGRGTTIEDYHREIAGAASPELVKRLLTSPRASSKVITLEGKQLSPIEFPTRKLNSAENHRVRVAIDEVAASGKQAKVTITWAQNPGAVALKGLLNRSLPLDIRRFDDVPNIADLLLSLRLVRREADVVVAITRALRHTDNDLDSLSLKELLGIKELAAAVPTQLQQVQQSLWQGLA